jgi:uncharacterized membrane protein YdbT with pleckstrin-like domain
MSYVQDNLMPNEKVLFSARIHPAVFMPAIVSLVMSIAVVVYAFSLASQQDSEASLLAGIVLLAAGGFFLYSIGLGLKALIIMLTTEFAVTNQRIIAKTGFIRRHTLEMLLPKIESVSVQQNILGRLLDFGTVTVIGTGGTKESFRPITGPLTARKKIHQIIEHYTAQVYAQQQMASNRGAGG